MVVGNIQHLTLNISKRIPFALQNESFCKPKGLHLEINRYFYEDKYKSTIRLHADWTA